MRADKFAYLAFGRDIEDLEAEELADIPAKLLEPWLEENEQDGAAEEKQLGWDQLSRDAQDDIRDRWMSDNYEAFQGDIEDLDRYWSALSDREKWEASLENGQNVLYKTWNEDDHPRVPAGGPDGGQFGAGGGGGGEGEGRDRPEGSGKPATGGSQAGGKPDAGLPHAFGREGPSDAQRSRNVVAVYRPTPSASTSISAKGHLAQTFYELGGAGGAKAFQNAITRAKTGTYGASVHVYSADEYKGMRLFMSPDGLSGFALKGDDIVSLFKHPDLKARGIANTSLMLATEQGGRRLDCFDTQLPKLYSNSGFRAVARVGWNDEYAPPGWDKSTYKEFNGGEPDVVFMVHDPAYGKLYTKGDGKAVKDYDDGTAAQLATKAAR